MYMNYITTTSLRTQSSDLIRSLVKGQSVTLIHRSQVVGIIKPAKRKLKKITKEDITQLKKLAIKTNLPALSYQERAGIYRKHLEEKYGKDIS